MNLANRLTVLRIILVIVMIIIAYIPVTNNILGIGIDMWILNIIFIVASITDKLDGDIARKRNQITDFGKFLDPIADKMLVLTAMLILVEKGMLPAFIPVIILIREFAISGYRLIALEKNNKVIAANMWGKVKTVMQITAIILAFINIDNTNIFGVFIKGNLSGLPLIVNILTTLAFVVAVIATIVSGYKYIKEGKELIKEM